jgi:hypothetical protein
MTTTIKMVPFTGSNPGDITLETAVSVTFVGRAANPYPPGNVLINGAKFPASTTGDVTMTWAHRYRFGPLVVKQDAASVPSGPEGNYTVTVSVGGVLKHTTTAITGTTFAYTYAQRVIDDADPTKLTTITITPVNGALSGNARSLTFLMNP